MVALKTHKRGARRVVAFLIALLAWGFFTLACALVERTFTLPATLTAVVDWQTHLAGTSRAMTEMAATLLAPPPLQTLIPPPPTTEQTVPDSPEPLTQTALASEPDRRALQAARILLFENMSASRQIRLVQRALDWGGYFYLDVGSATGWFKSQLLSEQEWDLVIAAAEAERPFGGEFYTYLYERFEQGAALIVEDWNLDAAPSGRVQPLLRACGVRFQLDWYQPELRAIFWTDPYHPLLQYPNMIARNLRNAPILWPDDVGDLLRLDPDRAGGSGAVILAGTNPRWKEDHGLLVSCVEGRLILQTFRSHEYQHDDMVSLWQNYIYHALKSRFALKPPLLPPPPPANAVATPIEPPASAAASTPGPEYSIPRACGDFLTVRFFDAPRFQRDLFEHHAEGFFLILSIEVVNHSTFPIHIWDEDYRLEGLWKNQPLQVKIHRPASGYLYIERGGALYQGVVEAGQTWRTRVAFDVPSAEVEWTFTLRPGGEFNEQICEVSLPLNR